MIKQNTLSYASKHLSTQLEQLNTVLSSAFSSQNIYQKSIMNLAASDTFARLQESVCFPYNSFAKQINMPTIVLPESFISLQKQLNAFSKAYGAEFSELMQNSAIASPEKSFSPLYESLEKLDYSHINEQVASALKPILSTVESININGEHVEVTDHFSDMSIPQKRILNREQALSFFYFFIPTLIAILSWLFPNPLSHFQENHAVQEISLSDEQMEQISDCLSKLVEYTEYLSEQCEAIPESPAFDSLSQTSQPEVATPSAATRQDHEDSCTCCNIQPPSVAE